MEDHPLDFDRSFVDDIRALQDEPRKSRGVFVTAIIGSAVMLGALAWLATEANAQTSVSCAPWSQVKARFADRFHEVPVSGGVAGGGNFILQVIASPDGATFTVFMIDRLGIACAMASGTGWEPGSNPVQKETRG